MVARRALHKARELIQDYNRENHGQKLRLPLTELQNLIPNQRPGREARHVTIAIAGFMSQDSDNIHEWQKLIDHLEESGSSVFSYRWESKIPSNVIQGAIEGAKGAYSSIKFIYNNLYSVLTRYLKSGAMAALAAGIGIVQVGCGVANVFKESKRNAKLAGKLLACALALRDPFHSQSVSLVGFSLGT